MTHFKIHLIFILTRNESDIVTIAEMSQNTDRDLF